MNVPHFLSQDCYLQIPIMHRFLKEHKIPLVHNKADYITAIIDYANKNTENEQEVTEWLKTIAKEGSKDMCYRKIYNIEDWHRDFNIVESKIIEAFPKCPRKSILNYHNTPEQTLIDFNLLLKEDKSELERIEFVFSRLYLRGEAGSLGVITSCPMYVEVYLNEGFIISRCKAKSTLFNYNENNHYLDSNFKVDTMEEAVNLIDQIVQVFGYEIEREPKRIRNATYQMLYRIYEQYTFTPLNVVEKVESQIDLVNGFVNQLFQNLKLDIRNKETALLDCNILVEKFISINGDNEELFKNDRPAYLIKVSSDNEAESTRIDTQSVKTKPLQCTEVFFDSKKSIVSSKMGKKLQLIFKRENEKIFSKANPLVVQFGALKDFGYVKTMQYAQEADIQHVLQAIFDNY